MLRRSMRESHGGKLAWLSCGSQSHVARFPQREERQKAAYVLMQMLINEIKITLPQPAAAA